WPAGRGDASRRDGLPGQAVRPGRSARVTGPALMDVEASLVAMQSTLADADAELVMVLGGHREVTQARLWQGKVLVDWEADEQAGGCLLRPELVRRLIALHAQATSAGGELRLRAS